jgi:cytochrome c5
MKAVKWILGFLAVMLFAVGIFAYVTVSKGAEKAARKYSMDYDDAMILHEEEAIEAGRYLAETHGCTDCHGGNLAGQVMADAPPFLLVASNLTRGEGGVGSEFSDADWLRAIRHGVGMDGRGLFIMPSKAYYYFSDEEVGALIGYLQQVEPVDNVLPPVKVRTLGKLIMGMGDDFKAAPEMIPDNARPVMPEKGPTAQWGEYRATILCTACHGYDLAGAQAPDPDSPCAPNLRVVGGWGLDGFVRAMREGTTPAGQQLDTEYMPWEDFGRMTDTDLEGIFRYLDS